MFFVITLPVQSSPLQINGGRRVSRAFSLIELLVVVAIVAILAGMTIAALSSKKGAEITQAGGMASDLSKLARQYALAKNTRTILVVAQVNDGGIERSAISVWDASTNQLEKWNLLPESVVATNAGPSSTVTLPTTFRGAPVLRADYFVFHPDGHMTQDLAQIPRLEVKPRRGDTANTFAVVFNALTGLSRIERQ